MTSPDKEKVWLITGASRGFGRIWARAALERGDKVAASARDPASLSALVDAYGDAVHPIRLDVTDRAATFHAVAAAKNHFGRLDVVLSNAGYGYQGAVEEASEADARAQMDTKFFGTLWQAQAAMSEFRSQGYGHLLAVSSVLGVFSAPTFGLYSASKFAVEGLFEALNIEAPMFGASVTLIEPAGYATDFGNASSAKFSTPTVAYDPLRAVLAQAFKDYSLGDPNATAQAVLKAVDAPEPPLRLALGATAVHDAVAVSKARIANWEAWQATALTAQGSTEAR